MSVRSIGVVGLALTCGASAAVGVSRMNGSPAAAGKVDMVPVVVAAVELPRGTAITAELLSTTEWPKERLPAGAITETEKAVGRTVVIPLLKGEPLLEPKVADSQAGRGVAPLVKSGMRAFTVLTPTLASGVAGLILPGNKVDVLWTATTNMNPSQNDPTGGGTTVTLLQNVEILAVDQQIEAPDEQSTKDLRSVTLMVTENQAKRLSLAQSKGTLNLALRNDGDVESIDSPIVTLNDIKYAQGRPPEVESADEKSAPLIQQVAAIVAPKPATPTVQQPVRVRIRTLHGRHPGQVQLELYGRAAVPEPPAAEPAKPAAQPEGATEKTDG